MTGQGPDKIRTVGGWVAGLVALAALAYACRGAPLGTPAADDYDYLYALRFERPLDLWGPMGSAWYWRPLSRQLYFSLFHSWMLDAPARLALVHAVLLFALFALVYRTARRSLDPASAAAIATFPLLALPARALLGWPTGAQPLLGMVFVALSLHEAVARRWVSSLVALAAALLSHSQAILAVPVVPVAGWILSRDRRTGVRLAVGAAAVAAAYFALAGIAQSHGAGLPPRATLGEAASALPGLLVRSGAIQLGLDELAPGTRGPVLGLESALALVTLLAFASRRARRRLRARAPAVVLGATVFVVGIALVAFAPGLFTPRHTCLPSLGLAVAVGVVAGSAAEVLAVLWIGVRLAALLLSPAAPPALALDLPGGTVPMSFQEIVRLQRTAGSAHTALLAAYPRLPAGTAVRYWSLPRSSEVAFSGERAVCVWYGDSTLDWTFWDRARTPPEAEPPPTLAFNLDGVHPAVVMRPEAIRGYERGMSHLAQGRFAAADGAFAEAALAQEPRVANFSTEITRLRARLAFERGNYGRADSLNEVDRAQSGPGASYHELKAVLLWQRGDRDPAAAAAQACLALMPGNGIARAILDSVSLGIGGPMAWREASETGSPKRP